MDVQTGFQAVTGDYEKYCFLGCDAMYSGRSVPMFRRNVMPPASGSKSLISKKTARSKQDAVCLVSAPTFKMEAVNFSETSVNFYQTTRRQIPENFTLRIFILSILLYFTLLPK
jgi:hypothetical protein